MGKSLEDRIEDRIAYYERRTEDLARNAMQYGLSAGDIRRLRVDAVRGAEKASRYFEQHEADLSRFQDAALDPYRQEVAAQDKEVLAAAARGEVTSREQLETGSLRQTAEGNLRSALAQGERIAQLGSSALQAANRRAHAEEASLRQQLENQKRSQSAQVLGTIGGLAGMAYGGWTGGHVGAKIGATVGTGLGEIGGALGGET